MMTTTQLLPAHLNHPLENVSVSEEKCPATVCVPTEGTIVGKITHLA